jgi:hypothetical protein
VDVVDAVFCCEGIGIDPCDASVAGGSFRFQVAKADVFLLCRFLFVKGIIDATMGSKTRREGGVFFVRRN